MASNESFNRDPLLSEESFSQLLESSSVVGLDLAEHCNYSSGNYLTMLCFENQRSEGERGNREKPGTIRPKYGITSASDSSASSSNNSGGSSSVSKSKRTQSGEEKKTQLQFLSSDSSATTAESRKLCKKSKVGNPSSISGSVKVRKEKLGERITALQQLVSPYGKTDTASVLHEAMGYIRFLHEQVQALSSPYLQRLPSSADFINKEVKDQEEEEEGRSSSRQDLRSRGLCLVPVSCTTLVANSNGADLWSPAMGNN